MSNDYSMDLLEALRSGVDADTLIQDFQEQMMDAQMQYNHEQEEMRKADSAEANLQAIRENLAHDFLDYVVALGIMPAEDVDKDDYDFMLKVITETENELTKIGKLHQKMKGLDFGAIVRGLGIF